MSRALVLGNGSLLVCFGEYGQVRDFYFPRVGSENHMAGGLTHKIGVFADGRLSWVDDGSWRAHVAYSESSMTSAIALTHEGFGITLLFSDVVYNESNVFVRKLRVVSSRGETRTVKVFFNQQFFISESARGDTAYYSPNGNVIIHYEGRRVFLISGSVNGRPFDDYSVGLFGIEGKEGTWKDAEDGMLSKNPIEYGTVDSTIAFTLTVPPRGDIALWYWIAAGTKYQEVAGLHRDILARTPEHLHETASDFWHAWIDKNALGYCNLPEEVIRLYQSSLFVLRSHTDKAGGIIASGDSSILQHGRDTYAYVWPRDGAYAALAFLEAGYHDLAQRFFSFMNEEITADGYLLHKYLADGSLGSSWHPWVRGGAFQPPIQEDETATVIWALWQYYEKTRDLEFIEAIYNSLIKRAAEFFLRYRDEKTGLPLPSHGLWEDQFGTHAYTSASVYGGLVAGARFAALLGKEESGMRYLTAARRMKDAILLHFLREDGFARKSFTVQDGGYVYDETPDSASWYGLFRFGVLACGDGRLTRSLKAVESALRNRGASGGLLRFTGDAYYRMREDTPGNPWIITTLWAAFYRTCSAQKPQDLEQVRDTLAWAARAAHGAALLPEQLNPETMEPLSATPLVWSHAEYILLVQAFLKKARAFGICPEA